MNTERLARALRAHASFVEEVEDSLVPTDRVPTQQEAQHQRRLKDSAELTRVLARLLEGKPIDKAFGAPGDWGYGTPIGDALAAAPLAQTANVGGEAHAPERT